MVLLITGMKGNSCREVVAGALEAVCGVREVHVNLYRARATIMHDSNCHTADLIAAIERAGYGASQSGNHHSPTGPAKRGDARDQPVDGTSKERSQ